MPRTMLCRLIAEPAPPSESNKIKILFGLCSTTIASETPHRKQFTFFRNEQGIIMEFKENQVRKKSKTFFLTSIRVQLRLVFDSENSDSEARPSVIIILYCTAARVKSEFEFAKHSSILDLLLETKKRNHHQLR